MGLGLQALGFPHQDPPLESINAPVGQEEAEEEVDEAMEEATRKQNFHVKRSSQHGFGMDQLDVTVPA